MIMKYIKFILIIAATLLIGSCSSEKLDSNSIFPTESPERNAFDTWLLNNYTASYNIAFNYLYKDNDTDQSYNVIPAEKDKSIALAIMIKHVWLEAYLEYCGVNFIKTYSPRVMQLIGSAAYNTNGSMVMGTAEGGLKVMLYNVNAIDIDNPYIDVDNPYVDKTNPTKDLNYYFFHTMHHEFGHILNQKKNYSTDFNLVSAAKYKSTDWINLNDANAPKLGFVSGYASSEASEDFVEIYSIYITHTEACWQKILSDAVNGTDTSGRDAIIAKFNIVKNYFKISWNIDITELRDVILKRFGEVKTLDLRNLK